MVEHLSKYPRYYDRDGRVIDRVEAQRLYDNVNYRTLAEDQITPCDSSKCCRLTTTWLGIDYGITEEGPLIFITRIHGSEYDGKYVRYPTEQRACDGHSRALVQLWGGVAPWFLR